MITYGLALFWHKMKIHYLGTSAAEGFPAIFCNCNNCKAARKIGAGEYRTRSQVLIDGIISVDFPPDALYHALKNGVEFSALKYILVTHSHMDHFYAHDFVLHGYKYAAGCADLLQIYGNEEVLTVFAECTAREMREQVKSHIELVKTEPFTEFYMGGYRVLTIAARHCTTEKALLYYVERNGQGYLHLYDTCRLNKDDLSYLKKMGAKADVVSLDCTFFEHTGGDNVRHMGVQDGLYTKNNLLELGVADADTRFVLTHFSHNGNPLRERLKAVEEEYGVTAAYDGMLIEI